MVLTRIVRHLTLVVLALVAVAGASAQVTTGSILGTVRDQSGALCQTRVS